MSETDLLRRFMPALVGADPNFRIFRRNVGFLDGVRFGIPGQCDLTGVYFRAPHSIPVELELKSAHGRLTKPQERWAAFCRSWNIPYFLLEQSAGETPDETVNRWIETLVMWTRTLPTISSGP